MQYFMDTYKAQVDGPLKRKNFILEGITAFQMNQVLVMDTIAGSEKGHMAWDRLG